MLATLSRGGENGRAEKRGEYLERTKTGRGGSRVARGWLTVLRLHSSANRGIFVRFLSENKTFTAFLAPGHLRGLRVKWIGFAQRSARVSERATTRALIRASRVHDFRFDTVSAHCLLRLLSAKEDTFGKVSVHQQN